MSCCTMHLIGVWHQVEPFLLGLRCLVGRPRVSTPPHQPNAPDSVCLVTFPTHSMRLIMRTCSVAPSDLLNPTPSPGFPTRLHPHHPPPRTWLGVSPVCHRELFVICTGLVLEPTRAHVHTYTRTHVHTYTHTHTRTLTTPPPPPPPPPAHLVGRVPGVPQRVTRHLTGPCVGAHTYEVHLKSIRYVDQMNRKSSSKFLETIIVAELLSSYNMQFQTLFFTTQNTK